ncbi:uncharacterized protein CDAR_531351 [Caerostris darwini]|uniref:Uncharacterized protein n=1 Tax=Caerostris darwini TaxID=1538125 RepID=A0AAV4R0B1_9ARAC|nr:uncharacterized protein CDAR_531351 [Caerostris darwini]
MSSITFWPLIQEQIETIRNVPIDNIETLLECCKKIEIFHIYEFEPVLLCNQDFENNISSEYVNAIVNTVTYILENVKPCFILNDPKQHLRYKALNLLHSIGIKNVIQFVESQPFNLCTRALIKLYKVDNEENCLLGLKIIKDVILNSHFFCSNVNSLVLEMLSEFEKIKNSKICNRISVNADSSAVELLRRIPSSFILNAKESDSVLLPRSCNSLRVLAESPSLIFLVSYMIKKSYDPSSAISYDMVPHFLKIIKLKPFDEPRASPNFCLNSCEKFVCFQINLLEQIQVHLFKNSQKKFYNDGLVIKMLEGLQNLMKHCPSGAVFLRRKLIILFSNMFDANFYSSSPGKVSQESNVINIYNPIPNFLINSVIFNKGVPTFDGVRPLYIESLLKCLSKTKLTFDEAHILINLFLPVVYDATLPLIIQIKVCNFLLLLTDSSQTQCHQLSLMKAFNVRLEECETFFDDDGFVSPRYSYFNNNLHNAAPDLISSLKKSLKMNPKKPMIFFNIAECKTLIGIIIKGAFLIAKNNKNSQMKQDIFCTFFKYTVKNMALFNIPNKSYEKSDLSPQKNYLFKQLTNIFGVFSAADQRKIFTLSNINVLFNEMCQNKSLQLFYHSLLSFPSTSRELSTVFLDYILNHIEYFDNKKTQSLLICMLSNVLEALLFYFPKNQEILQIFLQPMIIKCMEFALIAQEPCHILHAMSILFKIIKNENLNNQLTGQPLFQLVSSVLQTLSLWYATSSDRSFRDSILNLNMNISLNYHAEALLSIAPLIIQPVVNALNGNSISLTLKALKVLQNLNKLNRNAVNNKISFKLLELVQALLHALKKVPDYAKKVAVELLNSFNKNRHIHNQIQGRHKPASTSAMKIKFKKNIEVEFPIDRVMKCIFEVVNSKRTDCRIFKDCLIIIKSYLAFTFKEDYRDLLNFLLNSNSIEQATNLLDESVFPPLSLCQLPRNTLKMALVNVLAITSSISQSVEIDTFLEQCLIHFTVYDLVEETSAKRNAHKIRCFIIVDAISNFMSCSSGSDSEIKKRIDIAIKALKIIIKSSHDIFGIEKAWKLTFFEVLSENICQLCYKRACHQKLFACKAIQLFLITSSSEWKHMHLVKFVKCLLSVIEDLSVKHSINVAILPIVKDILINTLTVINRNCYENIEALLKLLIQTLLDHIISPSATVRTEVKICFRVLKDRFPKIDALFEPSMRPNFTEIYTLFEKAPLKSKIGIIDGYFFCEESLPISTCFGDFMVNNAIMILCHDIFQNLDVEVSKDYVDLCKIAFKALMVITAKYSSDTMLLKILRKGLKYKSQDLSSIVFDCCLKIKPILPLEWYEEATVEIIHDGHDIRHLGYLLFLLDAKISERHQKLFMELFQKFISRFQKPTNYFQELNLRKYTNDLFQWISYAPCSMLDTLLDTFLKTETVLGVQNLFFDILGPLAHQYPVKTIKYFLARFPSERQVKRNYFDYFIAFLLHEKWGKALRHSFLKKNVYPVPNEFLKFRYPLLIWILGGDLKKPVDLKIKILELLVIPSFLYSMENGNFNILAVSEEKDAAKVHTLFINRVIALIDRLKDFDCEMKRPLLKFSCLLLECAKHYIDKDFETRLKEFAKCRVQAYDDYSFDPVVNCYWHLFCSYLIDLKIKLDPNGTLTSKIVQNSLMSYNTDRENVSKFVLDILIPNVSKIGAGQYMFTHWTATFLKEDEWKQHSYFILNQPESISRKFDRFNHIFQVMLAHPQKNYLSQDFLKYLLDAAKTFCNLPMDNNITFYAIDIIMNFVELLSKFKNKTENGYRALKATITLLHNFFFNLLEENSESRVLEQKILPLLVKSLCLYPDDKFEENLIVFMHHLSSTDIGLRFLKCSLEFKKKRFFKFLIFQMQDILVLLIKKSKVLKTILSFEKSELEEVLNFFEVSLESDMWQQPLQNSSFDGFQEKSYVLSDIKILIDELQNLLLKLFYEIQTLKDFDTEIRKELIEFLVLILNDFCCLDYKQKQGIEFYGDKLHQYCYAFVFRCFIRQVGWCILKEIVSIYPECLEKSNCSQFLNSVMEDFSSNVIASNQFNTSECKLNTIFEILIKTKCCDVPSYNFLVDVVKETNSNALLSTVLDLPELCLTDCSKFNSDFPKQEFYDVLKEISIKIDSHFIEDEALCAKYCEKIAFYNRYLNFADENCFYNSTLSAFHFECPKIQPEFLQSNFLSLKSVIISLPHLNLWKAKPFSYALCIGLINCAVQNVPLTLIDVKHNSAVQSSKIVSDESFNYGCRNIFRNLQDFKNGLSRMDTLSFFHAVHKLSTVNSAFAEDLWTYLFPKFWKFLNETETQEAVDGYEDFFNWLVDYQTKENFFSFYRIFLQLTLYT